MHNIDGLAQDCSNSSAKALELLQSCTKPSLCWVLILRVMCCDFSTDMPRPYRFKMVSMQFPPVKSERAIPFDENTLNIMSRDDVKRLKAARSSFKYGNWGQILCNGYGSGHKGAAVLLPGFAIKW